MEETAADLAYKECLVRNIRELFISSIVPENFLYRVHKHDKNVLTSDDIARFLKKCNSGLYIEKDINMELLDRLSKYNNWFECILKMLQDPALKQEHLVRGFEELKRKTDFEMGIKVARTEQEVNTNDILNRPVSSSDFDLNVQSDSVSISSVTGATPEMITQNDSTGMVNDLKCVVCDIVFTSAQHKEQHISGKQHLKKIKELAQSTPSGTPQKESPQMKSIDRADNSIDSTKYCYVCQLPLSSVTVAKQHYDGRSHKKRVEAQQLENGNTSNPLENSQEQTDSTEVVNSNSCSLLTDSIPSMSITDVPAQDDGCEILNGKSWCRVCKIELTSEQHKTQHVDGKAHQKKLKDFAQLEATAPINNVRATDATAAHDESITYCSVCKIPLTSRENATEHYKGKNHKKKLETVKVNAK